MKDNDIHYTTFKKGSKTYFNSSLFFPEKVRKDVFTLYGFVRVADDYVDAVPQQAEEFYAFRNAYVKARRGGPLSGNPIIDSFIELAERKTFKEEWVDAFLFSMEQDLKKTTYYTLDETLEYIYGSAEVIGLFMCRVLDLPEASYLSAKMQGRSMQFINFIRDINEDLTLGRTYLPLGETKLKSLAEEDARANPEEFIHFIRNSIHIYEKWQAKAEEGYSYIPKRYLVPIKTASDMYNWTAGRLYKDPFLIYKKKVKPSKGRILLKLFGNALFSGGSKKKS